MSERHAIERRLGALAEVGEIMASMKTLALLEAHRLARRLEHQRRVVAGILTAADDFRRHFLLPAPETGTAPERATARLSQTVAGPISGRGTDLSGQTGKTQRSPSAPRGEGRQTYLVIGSERGFCGGFNQDLRQDLSARVRADEGPSPLLVAVGRRLWTGWEGAPVEPAATLSGAVAGEEAEAVLTRVLDTLDRLQQAHGPLVLTVLHHAEEPAQTRATRLLPPFPDPPAGPAHASPPCLNLPPLALLPALVEHYLLARLYELLYTSLLAENRRRAEHLDGALHRIEHHSAALAIRRNACRQEEITEEIEIILLGAEDSRRPRRLT